MKRIGLRPDLDNLNELLLDATLVRPNSKLIQLLVSAGAAPNYTREEHSALSQLFQNVQWWHSMRSDYGDQRMFQILEAIELLFSHGVKYEPDKPKDFQHMRKMLRCLDGRRIIDFLRISRDHNAISESALAKIFNIPEMRQHIQWQIRFLPKNVLPLFDRWKAEWKQRRY